MKNKKLGKLSVKIALYFVACFVGVMLVATLIGAIVLKGRYGQLTRTELMNLIYVGISFLGLLTLIAFAICMHRLIVKRINVLNKAMDDVAKGNFKMAVPMKGNDELTALADKFNMMSSELQANELLSKEFARYVSHEFKTPLSIIRGYAELLEAETNPANNAEYAGIIMAETDRLSEISKNIMELCTLDSTTIIKREDTFSPATQTRTILQSTHMLWDTKNIHLDLDLDDFTIISNEQMLFRVWQNLISNAVKFTGKGGTIQITLKRTGDSFSFQIADNGVGIDEADKEKVFSQFFVGDRSRNTEGSGLGLTLSRKIVERLGGRICFESKFGEGSKFMVTLPYI